MKKTYTQPTLDLVEMEVEQGIAMSTQTVDGFDDIYLTEEDVKW
jgi:hypothetical protein